MLAHRLGEALEVGVLAGTGGRAATRRVRSGRQRRRAPPSRPWRPPTRYRRGTLAATTGQRRSLRELHERPVVGRVARPGPLRLQELVLGVSSRQDRRRAPAARRARTSRATPSPARPPRAAPRGSPSSSRCVFGSSCCSPTSTTSARARSASIDFEVGEGPGSRVEHALRHIRRDGGPLRRLGRGGSWRRLKDAATPASIRTHCDRAGMPPFFVAAVRLVNANPIRSYSAP